MINTRIIVTYDHDTRLWICSPPGSWPTDWPTWTRAMQEAAWHAHMLRELHTPRPMWALRRRLQALQAQGYDTTWIAKKLDVRTTDVTTWSTDTSAPINSPTISRRIITLYDWVDTHTGGQIRETGPTKEARAGNWPAPAAWENIDNEAENPTVAWGDLPSLANALVERMGSQKAVSDAVGMHPGHLNNFLSGKYARSEKWESILRDLWLTLTTQVAA